MSRKYFLLILFCLFLSVPNWITAQNVRGLYVNNFKNILGQEDKENELLEYIQSEDFNYLLLYNFYFIHHQLFDLTQSHTAAPLTKFIHKAKTQYGVEEIGAVGETFQSFSIIDQYNQMYIDDPTRRIDVYNIEYEFWNESLSANYYCNTYLQDEGLDCNTMASFQFYIKELKQLKQLAQSRGVKTETYIGLPTQEQCQQIGETCDRVLVHYYRKSDVYNNGNSIYNFKSARLPALAPSEGQLAVMPIFASRSNFMGPWLMEHVQEQAFETYLYGQNGYHECNDDWKEHIKIDGYQWYRYTDMLKYNTTTSQGDLVIAPQLSAQHGIQSQTVRYRLPDSKPNQQKIKALEAALATVRPYPNPTDQQLFIRTENLSGVGIQLFNLSGDLVEAVEVTDQTSVKLRTADLPEGLYFLKVGLGKYQVARKVVVVHL